MTDQVLVIGDVRDVHLAAVVGSLRELGGPEPVVVDAPLLTTESYTVIGGERITIGDRTLDLNREARGWLRRSSPTMWAAGMVAGSLEWLERRAFLTLVASISRLGGIDWLTSVDAMLRAEDRLLQLETAQELGYRTPRTVVTGSAGTAKEFLGDQFVVKPLSMGYFHTPQGPRAVYSTELSGTALDQVDFADAPFVAQETIDATEHLRIVTVGDQAWAASLTAAGRPLDWRQQDEAHSAWHPAQDDQATAAALRLAREFNLGYSSQDWIHDGHSEAVFVDLNPGGQWLFLPEPVSLPVTHAIAEYLAQDPK